jgi:UDP-3-O-[3-hydroxymyristoyl] glucosamine N-acyltransferase
VKFSEIPLLQGCFEADTAFDNLGFLFHPFPGLLVYCLGRKFVQAVNHNENVVGVITLPKLAGLFRPDIRVATAADPQLLYYQVHNHLADHTNFYHNEIGRRIAATARIHPSCVMPERNVIIGEDVQIGPHVTIYEGTVIGDGAVIQPGAVIGLDSLQVVKRPGRLVYVRHAGGVIIGRGAWIGANSCVERGVFRHSTVVGEEAAVGELACIGHGASLGRRSLVLPCSTVCGSTVVGEEALISPAATVSNCLDVGAGASVGLGALVKSSVAEADTIVGQPSPTARQAAEILSTSRRG